MILAPRDTTIQRMAEPRIRVASLSSDVVCLAGEEAHHALRVRRLRAGDRVVLFDGVGGEARAQITRADADRLEANILSRTTTVAPRRSLTLAVAMPKGPRADWLVEKAAELGVRTLIPLICHRSVVRPATGKLARWRRICTSAAKQCGAALEMTIEPPAGFATILQRAREHDRVLFGHPDPEAPTVARLFAPHPNACWLALIGPEGGWTNDELGQLGAAGATPARLASTTLRIETAAIAVAALWAAES